MTVPTVEGDDIRVRRARSFSRPDEGPALHDQLRELAVTAEIPVPHLWLEQTPVPNAYATGFTPDRSSITVSSGLLGHVSPRELRAVLAHEIGHIALDHGAARMALADRAMRGVSLFATASMGASVLASFTDGWLDDLLAGVGGALFTRAAAGHAEQKAR